MRIKYFILLLSIFAVNSVSAQRDYRDYLRGGNKLYSDSLFEKSEVEATLTAPIVSIKNPATGYVRVPEVGEIIMDDPNAKGEILVG